MIAGEGNRGRIRARRINQVRAHSTRLYVHPDFDADADRYVEAVEREREESGDVLGDARRFRFREFRAAGERRRRQVEALLARFGGELFFAREAIAVVGNRDEWELIVYGGYVVCDKRAAPPNYRYRVQPRKRRRITGPRAIPPFMASGPRQLWVQ